MTYAYCIFLAPPIEHLGYCPNEKEVSRLVASLDARGWLDRPIVGAGYTIDVERVSLDSAALEPWIAAGVAVGALLFELDGAAAALTRAIVHGDVPPARPSGGAASAPLEPRECGAVRIMMLPRLARLPLNSVSGERMSCPKCGAPIPCEAGGHSSFLEAASVWAATHACASCGTTLELTELYSHTREPFSGQVVEVQAPFLRFGLALCAVPGVIKAADLPDTHDGLPSLIKEITGMQFRQVHQYW